MAVLTIILSEEELTMGPVAKDVRDMSDEELEETIEKGGSEGRAAQEEKDHNDRHHEEMMRDGK